MSTAAAFAPARRTGLPEMRLLSVRQPWAWQILHEHKDVENRIIPTSGYRGWVAIHAARTPDDEALGLLPAVPPRWVDAERQFEYEAVIGVVRLVDVHDASWCGEDQYGRPLEMCSPWALRSFLHLVLTDPHPLPQPIPRIGRLGLGLARPDRHLVEKVCEQLPFL